jgi:hypothetical protein
MTVIEEPSNPGAVGGLFGRNNGTLKDIRLTDVYVSDASPAGGLVGYNSGGTITGCTSSSTVSSSSSSSYYYYYYYGSSVAGGLVGYNNGGTITGCTSSGKNISAYSENGTAYRGGFIGCLYYVADYYMGSLTGNRNDTGISPAIGYDRRIGTSSENINDDI